MLNEKKQNEFLDHDGRKMAAIFPPATKLAPEISVFKFDPNDLDDSSLQRIEHCCKILQKSSHPWAGQNSSTILQHLRGIVGGLLVLDNDSNIYTGFLGEKTVWLLFKQILAIIRKLRPSYMPWHEILLRQTEPTMFIKWFLSKLWMAMRLPLLLVQAWLTKFPLLIRDTNMDFKKYGIQ